MKQLQALRGKLKAFKSIATHVPIFRGFSPLACWSHHLPAFQSITFITFGCQIAATVLCTWPILFFDVDPSSYWFLSPAQKPKNCWHYRGNTGIWLETWYHETNKLDRISHIEFNSIHINTFSDWIYKFNLKPSDFGVVFSLETTINNRSSSIPKASQCFTISP